MKVKDEVLALQSLQSKKQKWETIVGALLLSQPQFVSCAKCNHTGRRTLTSFKVVFVVFLLELRFLVTLIEISVCTVGPLHCANPSLAFISPMILASGLGL